MKSPLWATWRCRDVMAPCDGHLRQGGQKSRPTPTANAGRGAGVGHLGPAEPSCWCLCPRADGESSERPWEFSRPQARPAGGSDQAPADSRTPDCSPGLSWVRSQETAPTPGLPPACWPARARDTAHRPLAQPQLLPTFPNRAARHGASKPCSTPTQCRASRGSLSQSPKPSMPWCCGDGNIEEEAAVSGAH